MSKLKPAYYECRANSIDICINSPIWYCVQAAQALNYSFVERYESIL